MLFELFTRKFRKEILEKTQENLRLKEENDKLKKENDRLAEVIKYRNLEYKELEDLFISQNKLSTKLAKQSNKNIELKSNILKLFQYLGIKENSYSIPVIQMYNKELINSIFENIREENNE